MLKRALMFTLEWFLQGLGIGIGLCIALPLSEFVKAILLCS